jgi:hypothetical protein
MADTIRKSLDARLYRSLTTAATPSIECDSCKDVTVKMTKSEAKLSNRLSNWEMVRGAMKSATFDVEFNDDSADPHLAVFLDSYNNGTPVRFWIKDAVAGEGVDAIFECMEMDDTQKLDDIVQYKFTLKPTYTGYGSAYPTWH